jgi:hypothetical protein
MATKSSDPIYIGGGVGITKGGAVSMAPPSTPFTKALDKARSARGGGGGGGGGSSYYEPSKVTPKNVEEKIKEAKTPAEATKIYNQYTKYLRSEAGIVGKKLTLIQEQNAIKQFLQKRKLQAEVIASTSATPTTSSVEAYKPFTEADILAAEKLKKETLPSKISSIAQEYIFEPIGSLRTGITGRLNGKKDKNVLGVSEETISPSGFGYKVEQTSFLPTGRGTSKFIARERTIYETLGYESSVTAPEYVKEFVNNYETIQGKLNDDKINLIEAQNQLLTAQREFQKQAAIRQVPKDIAIGALATIATIYGTPIVASAVRGVGYAMLSSAIANIDRIALYSREFPEAAKIRTAGILAAGLTSKGLIKGFGGKQISINSEDLAASPTYIKGIARQEIIDTALMNPKIANQIKYLGTKNIDKAVYTYQIKTKAGETFNVLQIDKGIVKVMQSPMGKSATSALPDSLIFAVKVGGEGAKESFYGKAVTSIKGNDFSSSARVIKFSPSNSKILRALEYIGIKQQKSQQLDILTKGSITARQGQSAIIETKSVIQNIGKISEEIRFRAKDMTARIKRGEKLNLNEVRGLFDLSNKARKLFSETAFKSAAQRGLVITETAINSSLREARLALQKSGYGLELKIKPNDFIIRKFETQFKGKPFMQGRIMLKSKIAGSSISRIGKAPRIKAPSLRSKSLFRRGVIKARGIIQRRQLKIRASKLFDKAPYKRGVSLTKLKRKVTISQYDRQKILLASGKSAIQTAISLTKPVQIRASLLTKRIPSRKVKSIILKTTEKKQLSDIQKEPINLKSVTYLSYKPKVKSNLSDFSGSKFKQASEPTTSFFFKEQPAYKQNSRFFQQQPQAFKLRELQRFKYKQTPSFKQPTLKIIRRPKPQIFKGSSGFGIETGSKFKSSLRLKPSKFDVYTRQGKRINPLPLSRKAAAGLGFKKTDIGIKASFFIRPTSRAGFMRSKYLEKQAEILQPKFQPSKRVKGLIVEKPRFRLERAGRTREVKEIQAFRRRL